MNELEIIRHSRVDGLSIFFNTVDYRTPHFHTEWELIWVLKEPLSVTCQKASYRLEPGQMVLFSPNMVHEFRKIGDGCTFLCVQASPSLLQTPRELTMDALFPGDFLLPEKMAEVKARLRTAAEAYLEQSAQYALFCLGQTALSFRELFCAMPNRMLTREEMESQEQRNRRLSSLIRFVDENYMGKIRLSDFAAQEGYTMTYLSHFIKEAMNQTFQEYVTSVRVNCACQRMASENRKLLEICHDSGFSDYRYFCRAFRAQFGMTPEQYRQQLIKPEASHIHRSLHSQERFFDNEQSKRLLAELPI